MNPIQWFKNLKIRNKLLSIAFLLYIIILLTAFSGIYGIAKTRQTTETMYSHMLIPVLEVSAMDSAFSKISADLWFVVHAPKPQMNTHIKTISENEKKLHALIESYEARCAAYDWKLEAVLKKYGREILLEDETKTMADIKKVLGIYKELSDGIITLSSEGKISEAARTLMMTDAIKGQIHEAFENLININKAFALVISIEARSIFRDTLFLAGLLFGLCVIAGASASFFVSRTISIPLRTLAVAAGKISAGDYTTVDVKTTDELGSLASAFNLMSGSIKEHNEAITQAMAELRLSEKKWEETFDAMPYGVSIHDGEYNILKANRFLSNLLKEKNISLNGKKCCEVVHGIDKPLPICPLARSIESGMPEEAEIFEPSLDMHIRVMTSPMKDEAGNVYAFVHSIIDITEAKKAEKMILESRDAFFNMLEDISESYKDLQELFMGLVRAMANALDAKSPWTRGHSARVSEYAVRIAEEMGFDEDGIKEVRLAGLLHDIGKIGTYDYLLDKPAQLTDEEFEVVKKHPAQGAEMLAGIKQLKNITPLIRYHHERIDGRGYPDGIKGDEIPLGARILHVADSFDSMTADRPYRPSPGVEYAVSELLKYSGTQFDPQVADAFLITQRLISLRS